MSSNEKRSPFRTVTFRLTAWYALLFAAVSVGVLLLAQARLQSVLRARTDSDLQEDLREWEHQYSALGLTKLKTDFESEERSTGAMDLFAALVSPDGSIRVSTDLGPWRGLPLQKADWQGLEVGDFRFRSLSHPLRGDPVRTCCLGLAGGETLCLGLSLQEEQDALEIFRGVLLLALVGMLLSGSVMGWLLARRAMAGVGRVTFLAASIQSDRLGARVDVGHEGQEIEDLAVAFNGMLERIDSLVRSLREVTDNLAHDMRSPITRLRGLAETTLTSNAGIEEYRELAADVVEESDSLVALLNTMLEIAETDSGRAKLELAPVDVGALVREIHELYRPAAEDHGIRLVCDPAPARLFAKGDLARLQRVLSNLLDNAFKYTPSGGTVTLTVTSEESDVAITVQDTGAGIEAKDLPKIFERFFRADASRSQSGNGLGLSLSQAIVNALGGTIDVKSEVGQGSVFTIRLPRVDERTAGSPAA